MQLFKLSLHSFGEFGNIFNFNPDDQMFSKPQLSSCGLNAETFHLQQVLISKWPLD
jgi:hypothetical protein